MQFNLNITPKPFTKKISAGDGLFLIGSCFTEEISNKLREARFHTFINPHGILFNPQSIAGALNDCIRKEIYTKNDLVETNGTWHSWNHHSRFNHFNPDEYLSQINSQILSAHSFLAHADWLVVTFGSAHAYTLKKNGQVVGNCHKEVSSQFEKVLLSFDDIVGLWTQTVSDLRSLNPGVKIVFTLSPVRYLRDGIVESNLSKAVLLQAIHQIQQQTPDSYYFPAYELVIDDLRDYRFFKEDLTHPNEAAVNYVWEKFITTAMDETTAEMIEELQRLNKFLNHKSLSNLPTDFEKHENKKRQLLASLKSKFPKLNWEQS